MNKATSRQEKYKNIIFFDGVCHLCNSFVDFVIKQDLERQFLFAPLQGETAKKILDPKATQELNSVIFWTKPGEIYSQSQAVLKIFQALPYPYKAASGLGRILPGKAQDLLYALVAKNRYQWFGEKSHCRIPSPEEKNQFLP